MKWSPSIGDPTPVGWLTVGAYFLAAAFCCRATLRGKANDRGFWSALALLLLVLGVNKELDLQTLLTEVGKMLARREGWYQSRRLVQYAFLAALAVAAVVAVIAGMRLSRGRGSGFRISVVGIDLLLTFIVARATSFHHGDQLIGTKIVGMRLNWIFELGGIALVALGAGMAVESDRHQRR